MAAIIIRNVDDALERCLRMQAPAHGRSMAEDARNILRSALSREAARSENLSSALHESFKPHGGVKLDIREREPMRESPRFD